MHNLKKLLSDCRGTPLYLGFLRTFEDKYLEVAAQLAHASDIQTMHNLVGELHSLHSILSEFDKRDLTIKL